MPPDGAPRHRPHVLIASNDVVGANMAGPGMRYLEMARVLRADCDVTLAVPAATSLVEPGFNLVHYSVERPESLPLLVANADVAIVSGYMIWQFPALSGSRARLVVDLYDPFLLENLHYQASQPLPVRDAAAQKDIVITNRLARLGDFFICGSERQRDLWMGVLAANGRVNARTFAHDPALRRLIDVVGIGFPNHAPRARPMLRGVHPAFSSGSRIVLWGGGIWNWLDPLTLVRAWPATLARWPEARLVFLGTRHPNPDVPRHRMADDTIALAEAIGEKDRSIFFIEWVPYEERAALLNEADIGVTLHPVHVETRYAIRTRVLDYFWARLPVLVTEGDVTSEWVREGRLGRVVPPLDSEAVAAALTEMLARPKADWAPAFAPLPERFAWQHVVEPLRRYCLEGDYAPDRPALAAEAPVQRGSWQQAIFLWRTEGLRTMFSRGWRYLRLRARGF